MGDPTKAPQTIAGRYRIERPIGRGGMGTVWLCRDERLERDVAVKQIGTLAQVIDQDGPLSPEATVDIGAQLAEALLATHAAGTIHRDVKPGNSLVTSEGVAKISDFGIARAHDQSQLTRSGQVIGT